MLVLAALGCCVLGFLALKREWKADHQKELGRSNLRFRRQVALQLHCSRLIMWATFLGVGILGILLVPGWMKIMVALFTLICLGFMSFCIHNILLGRTSQEGPEYTGSIMNSL